MWHDCKLPYYHKKRLGQLISVLRGQPSLVCADWKSMGACHKDTSTLSNFSQLMITGNRTSFDLDVIGIEFPSYPIFPLSLSLPSPSPHFHLSFPPPFLPPFSSPSSLQHRCTACVAAAILPGLILSGTVWEFPLRYGAGAHTESAGQTTHARPRQEVTQCNVV